MCNNYSIDYCINNCEEFERVGFPELGRNEVFLTRKINVMLNSMEFHLILPTKRLHSIIIKISTLLLN